MIHKKGIPWILSPLCFSAGMYFIKKRKLAFSGILLSILNAYFFRNPRRECILNPELIISPSDGKIISCEIEENDKIAPYPLWKIEIFTQIWDVYINRSPVIGKILKIDFSKIKTGIKQVSFLIEREDGIPFWLIQTPKSIFQNCESFLLAGDEVIAGEPISICEFGSKTQLLFPAMDAEIYIKTGHKVFAGETVIGRYSLKK